MPGEYAYTKAVVEEHGKRACVTPGRVGPGWDVNDCDNRMIPETCITKSCMVAEALSEVQNA